MGLLKTVTFEKQTPVSGLSILDFMNEPVLFLDNVEVEDREDFEAFATNNQDISYLDYDGRPSFEFKGTTIDEVAPHFDGISASNPKKMPEWLVFWAQEEVEQGGGGAYIVHDCTSIGKDSELMGQLSGGRQVFVDYQKSVSGASAQDEFSIPLIQEKYGKPCLRMFLDPSDEAERQTPKPNTRLQDSKGNCLEHLRPRIHEHMRHPQNVSTVELKRRGILILNNHLCFHGRMRLNEASSRSFCRVQLLSTPK